MDIKVEVKMENIRKVKIKGDKNLDIQIEEKKRGKEILNYKKEWI